MWVYNVLLYTESYTFLELYKIYVSAANGMQF